MASTTPTPPPGAVSTLVRFVLAFGLAATSIASVAAAAAAPLPPKPSVEELRSIDELRRIPRAELQSLTNRVAVEGVVTFASQRWSLWFVQDATAGMYFFGAGVPDSLAPGERVRLIATPEAGRFAPLLRVHQLTSLGPGTLPTARAPDPERLLAGTEDSQFLILDGVVRNAVDLDGTLWNVAGDFGNFEVLFAGPPLGSTNADWVGATVRIQGVCASDFNARGQFRAFKLLARSLGDVRQLRPAPADPFQLPIRPLDRILEFSLPHDPGRRVRVTGTVTRADRRGGFYIQRDLHSVEVESVPGTPVPEVGDKVDVVGFASPRGYAPVVEFARWKKTGRGPSLAPTLLDLREVHGAKDGLLATVEGVYLDRAIRESGCEIALRDPAGRQVLVRFPPGVPPVPSPVPEPGTRIRVTGVYRVVAETGSRPTGHRIEARFENDISVLGSGSWWNTRNATGLAFSLAIVMSAGIAWMVTLRRQLARQRQALEAQHADRLNLEQVHRRLTEGAPDAIFTIDSTGNILSANPAAGKFTGFPERDLIGRSILDLLPSDDRPRMRTKIEERFRHGGEGELFAIEIIDRQQRRRYMEVTSRVLISPAGIPCIEGVARDITERKRAEDALKGLAVMAAHGAGDEFLRSVTRQVAELLEVRQAFVGILTDDNPPILQIPAHFCDGRFASPSRLSVPGGPWAGSGSQTERILPRDVRALFPQETQLARWNVEALVSMPLAGEDRAILGFLVLLHDRPFDPTPAQVDMLRILAARIGSEIARLHASEALRLSEERFRQLAEESEDVLWVIDLPSRRLAYIGPAFARIVGLPAGQTPRHLREILRMVHPEDRGPFIAAARLGLEQPEARYSAEFRIVRTDGSLRWMLDQGVLIRNSQGRPIRLSGVARDITPRKSAEIALAAERARFQELFENSPDAVFVESLEGIVLDVNQAACHLHRLPREKIVGRHITDLVPAPFRDRVRKAFERIKTGDASAQESVGLRSDGAVIPIDIRATRVRHHGVDALLLHVRDISARRHAAEFMAGQMRVLEWIATARPLSEILAELVRVTEARHVGSCCWIRWAADPALGPFELIGPSVTSDALPEPAQIVPVVAPSGRHVGTLSVAFPEAASFPPLATDVHRLAASLAGIAIERHLQDASLRDGAVQLRTANAGLLSLAGSEAVSQGDLGAALREISAAASQSVRVGRVSVWILEDSETVLRCVHLLDPRQSTEPNPDELRVVEFPEYFDAIARERLVAVADVARDPRSTDLLASYLQPQQITATLDAGIRLRGRLVGVVCFEHRDGPRTWKTEEELIAGSIADIVAMALQASERRCIEEALRQSEEAYRSVVGALAEGVMLIGRDGSFLTYNESATDILGLTQDALHNRALLDFAGATFHADGTPMLPADYPAAITLRTGQPINDASMAVRRPDGRLVWLSINARPFARNDVGEVSSVVVSFTDISRRLEAENALREGNQLLQAISGVQAGFIADGDAARTLDLMLAHLISMTSSQHGVVAQISPDQTAEGFRVFLPDPATGSPPTDPRQLWLPLVSQVLRTGQPQTLRVEIPNPAETGPSDNAATPVATHLLALPLRHDEAVVGIVGLARLDSPYGPDVAQRLQPLLITCANLLRAMESDRQRQQAEAQIRQLNAELEQRVELRTADLKAMNQELAEFAYVVTHDLKAPLRGIHQLSEWLAHDHSAQLDAGGLRLLALLRQRVVHLQRLIDGLLACAKVGRSPEPERSVPVLDLVRQIVSVIAPPSHITFQISPDLPVIEGNPDRLNQIFQNIIDNAIKYLDKPRGRIAVTATRERNAWTFRIADNGPGIPERYREKVFQIFQRLHQTGDIPGTGLGLTLVKRIVEARGGRIWIESEGIGTIVCFSWPDKGRPRSVPWEATALHSRVGVPESPTPSPTPAPPAPPPPPRPS